MRTKRLIRDMDDKVYDQAVNVATLPGIVQASYAMPDAHWGYGFPIGGVAAFDADEGGVVSAGGVGFDISCGVRTMLTGLSAHDIYACAGESLPNRSTAQIPAGRRQHGCDRPRRHRDECDARRWCSLGHSTGTGVRRAILSGSKSEACMAGAQPEHVSERAKERQCREMGTLGSGNHYLEVQAVTEIFDRKRRSSLRARAQMTSSSPSIAARADLGHQIGTEFLKEMVISAGRQASTLPDRELACAPINSEVGQRYLGAMRAGNQLRARQS